MIRLSPTAKISRAAAIRFFAVVLFAIAVAVYAISRPARSCGWRSAAEPSYKCAMEIRAMKKFMTVALALCCPTLASAQGLAGQNWTNTIGVSGTVAMPGPTICKFTIKNGNVASNGCDPARPMSEPVVTINSAEKTCQWNAGDARALSLASEVLR